MINEILIGYMFSGNPVLPPAEVTYKIDSTETRTIKSVMVEDRVNVYRRMVERKIESSRVDTSKSIQFDRHEWYGMRFGRGQNYPVWIYETVVAKGESLDKLAHKFNRIMIQHPKLTWQKLYEQNKEIIGNNPNHIEEGMILQYIIPIYLCQ